MTIDQTLQSKFTAVWNLVQTLPEDQRQEAQQAISRAYSYVTDDINSMIVIAGNQPLQQQSPNKLNVALQTVDKEQAERIQLAVTMFMAGQHWAADWESYGFIQDEIVEVWMFVIHPHQNPIAVFPFEYPELED